MHSSGKTTPEVIFTILHAGGKFEQSGYKVSGGLHGVGASVVNALSKWLEVTIKKDGSEYYIRFEDGGKVAVPLKKIGTTNKTGTTVRFMPDGDIFPNTNFSYTTIAERMQESAFLIRGLTIELIDLEDNKRKSFFMKMVYQHLSK
jgi:topoisomerase-4 subunit B